MSNLNGLLDRKKEIAGKRIVVGFDGFVDTIVRPLKQAATADTPMQAFDTIREFGEFLIDKAEKSCSVELNVEARQLGGNLPFLSRGAGGLGLDVTCIGMLGEGAVEKTFKNMPCKLYPYAASGQSVCMEFDDGKVLLATDYKLPRDAWDMALAATENKAPELFDSADLIALVNWSELSFAHGLWEHTLESLTEVHKERIAFFDLCDVSRKTDDQIKAVIELIGEFAKKRTAVLSLNENEAHTVAARLFNGEKNIEEIADLLRQTYGIDEIIIHTVRDSLLSTVRGVTRQKTIFVEKPKISTGAGDNFNAASCFGAVMGLSDEDRIKLANAFANYYVSEGRNASLEELAARLSE